MKKIIIIFNAEKELIILLYIISLGSLMELVMSGN